jgi:hypothetical protein
MGPLHDITLGGLLVDLGPVGEVLRRRRSAYYSDPCVLANHASDEFSLHGGRV